MLQRLARHVCVLAIFAGLALTGWAQVNPTGTVVGTVLDPSHAAIPGANVTLLGVSTGIRLQSQSGATGHFSISNVAPGDYIITVTKTGFKTGTYQGVVVAANQTYTLRPVLEVGSQSATVTVEAGQSVLQTQQTSVGTDISTQKVIQNLPSDSTGSSLYTLTMTDPAIQSMGSGRQSSAEGLPGGAINITIDGISAQWLSGKSGDPLFAMVSPDVSDTAQFSVVSAAGSAAQSGGGAVQVTFISKRGTNAFHGSVFDYFRNSGLDANDYFANLAGQPRPVDHLNHWGFSVGGPILKNKLFFFVDFMREAEPDNRVANATMLNANAVKGTFNYTATSTPDTSQTPWVTCQGTSCQADLWALAAAKGGNTTADSFVSSFLGKAASAATAPGVTLTTPPSTYQETLAFPELGSNISENPDLRLDYNINQNHSLEFDYHLEHDATFPDNLNGGGFTYPVAPFNTNQYGQYSDRIITALAWRWALSPSMNNEVRAGMQYSPQIYNGNQTDSIYPLVKTNLGTIHMRPRTPNGLLTNPYLGFGPFYRWDAIYQLNDTLAWVRGNHNLTFGLTSSRQRLSSLSDGNVISQVFLGMSGFEPMAANFNGGNFPGIKSADLGAAENLYGLLTGNVTSYSGSVAFDPAKREFATGIPAVQHMHQLELGFYGNDSWRVRPNLTVNYGLRWQYVGVPVDDYNEFFVVDGGPNAVYGISGAGNLFKPGTMTGATPTFTNDLGKQWYRPWHKGFAPSLGLAYEPQGGWFGNAGDTVLRAGYSIAYSSEGLFNFSGIASANPGYSGVQFAQAAPATGGAQPAGQFDAGTINIASMNIPVVTQNPATFQSNFALNPLSSSNSVNVFDPNFHPAYVESWTAGIQRSLGPHTALEIRYVGNHGVGLPQELNMNEANIFENHFLPEFNAAAGNLQVCESAATACKAAQSAAGVSKPSASSFGNWGLPGQAALPIMTAAFNPAGSSSQAARGFTQSNLVTDLQNGQAGSMANSIATTYNYWQDLMANGYPSNLFLVNPDARGGAYYMRNGLQSTYNGLIVELRRRPIHGITMNASYTFSKDLTNDWSRSFSSFLNEVSLRYPNLMKGPAPFDIRQAFKFYSIWDLPFGRGQRWANTSSWLNTLVGGWEFDSNLVLQSGRPGLLTGGLGGTLNQYDGGVVLNGMSTQQLQSQLGIYKTGSPAPGAVWYFPQSLLGPNGNSTNTAKLAACTTAGAACSRIFVYDAPMFVPDLSLVKNTQITERVGSQIQVQFLNAFNNSNFLWSGSAGTFGTAGGTLQSQNFGQVTNDAGARIIQFIGRITF